MYKCAFCKSIRLFEIIDFGDVALAGAFLKKEDISNEKKYPLIIVFCEDCYAVQVRDHIDPKVLFATDYYFSSAIKTLQNHFSEYADEVIERFLPAPGDSKVLEFGSNDGVLLSPLSNKGVGTVVGVDPAENIIKSIKNDKLNLINDFFNTACADRVVEKYGKMDVVMANNVFAHISDINDTTQAINKVLSDDGVFVFEVHYLGKIIEEMQYDFIYHEHIYYYSLIALQNHFERHGMVIFDIKTIPIHGGSIRYYATKQGGKYAQNVSSAVTELHEKELQLGYDHINAYQAFADRVRQKKADLLQLLEKIKSEQKSIVGYGASGRANTIIQYCDLTKKNIDYIIDDAPAKQGLFAPGSHLEIKNNNSLAIDRPDYVLLFAWSFYEEIAKKSEVFLSQGGKIIVPLPDVRIIDQAN